MNRNFLHWYWKYHSIVCEIVLCCSCLKQALLKISSWENDYDKPNHYSTKWGNLGDNEDSWTCNKQLSWQVVKGWLSPVIESESETFCSRSYDCKWKSKIGVIRDSEVQQNRGQKNKSPVTMFLFFDSTFDSVTIQWKLEIVRVKSRSGETKQLEGLESSITFILLLLLTLTI